MKTREIARELGVPRQRVTAALSRVGAEGDPRAGQHLSRQRLIFGCMDEGLDRGEIAQRFGITRAQLAVIIHGMKASKRYGDNPAFVAYLAREVREPGIRKIRLAAA